MKGGEDRIRRYLNLDLEIVPGNAKIKITHGAGPIILTGSVWHEEKAKKGSPAKAGSANIC